MKIPGKKNSAEAEPGQGFLSLDQQNLTTEFSVTPRAEKLVSKSKQDKIHFDIGITSSQDKKWLINYLANGATSMAKFVCDKKEWYDSDPKIQLRLERLKQESIFTARVFRYNLLKKFGLVLWGNFFIMDKKGKVIR